GEASPYYLFHPLAADRIADLLPGVGLIALLRDPVARAYSHYRHSVRLGYEALSFEAALEAEEGRLAGAAPSSFAHQHFSYQARGRYAEQLARYARRFAPHRMLALTSEAFFADPGPTLRRVLDFLDLDAWAPSAFPVHNRGSEGSDAPAGVFQRLRADFEPWNRRLARDFAVDVGPW
ncbi:MAG TPA: sulfotransferase, partial [Longimicrobiales bacterium]|nr:sulfotransferase [Longimicrobiales bacterium]